MADLQNLDLLVVEDSDADVLLITESLDEHLGVPQRIERAPSLTVALDLLAEDEFDAVLYDLGLPDARGIDGLRQLMARCPRTPVVVLTGMDEKSQSAQALAERAQDYLSKDEISTRSLSRAVTNAVQRQQLLLQIEELALVDALTGLRNRRGFETVARQQLLHAERTGVDLTLVYLDLDGFKGVNDRHGHGAGDRLLQEVASILETTCRAPDIVARLGGDEFVVLLTSGQADAATWRLVVERIRNGVAEIGTRLGFDIGISAGSARRPGGTSGELSTLLEEADAAMYADKQRHDARDRTR